MAGLKPDARTNHNPDPRYIRDLLDSLDRAGMNQGEVAARVGITPRALRYYKSEKADHKDIPYPVQYTIEQLASEGQEQSKDQT